MTKKIKICIISSQFMGFGKIGGFGMMTRELAEALSNKGFDISVVVPKKRNQKDVEHINNVKIYGIKLSKIFNLKSIFHEIGADIYHSQNPNLFTFFAQMFEPQKKHIITCRDPRNLHDWFTEMRYATWRRRLKTPFVYFFEAGPLIRYAIKKADVVGAPAQYLKNKIREMYGVTNAILLPNAEKLPAHIPEKAKEPTVCFVGRLDKRKRPERVFELAKRFSDVKFLIAGKAEDSDRQKALERKAANIKNMILLGYIDKFNSDELQKIYSESWILINTASREGLPASFIEAAGHGCAILSGVNPDNFASEFGYWAKENDFEKGFVFLLKNNMWKEKGQKGFEYVKDIYDINKALKIHKNIYSDVLGPAYTHEN